MRRGPQRLDSVLDRGSRESLDWPDLTLDHDPNPDRMGGRLRARMITSKIKEHEHERIPDRALKSWRSSGKEPPNLQAA